MEASKDRDKVVGGKKECKMDKTKIVFGTGIALAILAVLTAPAAADYNIFHIVPENSSCNPGEDVTVWVKVNTSYSDINAFQASIIFDPSVVNVTLAEKGTNPAWYLWEYISGDYGAKKFVSIRGSDVMGAFGPGELVLGKMTLHGEAAGISLLHFGNESELAADRTEISHPAGTIWPITTEDGTFTCTAPSESFTKTLLTGWNLISLPLINDTNMTVANIMGSLIGNYDAVYSYNATTKSWVSLSPLDTMANGVGYFIHMTSAGTWSYTGVAYTAMIVGLQSGLNMPGWLNCTKSISDLSSIAGNCNYVARWNATSQAFETCNPVAPAEFHDFSTLERGEGYFISAKAAGTLTETC
jgi:hypothetical protein